MSKSKFVLVDLSDDKAKELSEVISSKTSRKILDYLSGVSKVTESDLSKEVGIALSTVHYHISKLVEAGLVESVGFTYSSRGRKIEHYALANKYIIIAPKKTDISGLADKLRGILPALGIAAIIGGVGEWIYRIMNRGGEVMIDSSAAMMRSVPEASGLIVDESADMVVQEMALEAAPMAIDLAVDESAQVALSFPWVFVLILVGAIFGLLASVFWQWVCEKRMTRIS